MKLIVFEGANRSRKELQVGTRVWFKRPECKLDFSGLDSVKRFSMILEEYEDVLSIWSMERTAFLVLRVLNTQIILWLLSVLVISFPFHLIIMGKLQW